MANEFNQGLDPHTETARHLFKKQDIDDRERQIAKRLAFSLVYGGGVSTLIQQGLIKTYPQGKALLREFHEARPGIAMLQGRITQRLQERGYITTLWGRHLKPQEEHKALNALVQGCSADLMKAALRKVHHWLAGQKLESHLVNVVHDELMLDCRTSEVERLVESVPGLMSDARIAEVLPVETSCEISYTSWAEKVGYTTDERKAA